MTTPMSEESIMATGTFSVRNEHDCYTLDDGTVGIDPVWFRQCLRSFAAWVIERGKPKKWPDHDNPVISAEAFAHNETIDEYATAMRKLIENPTL